MNSNRPECIEKDRFDALLSAAMRDGLRAEAPSERVRTAVLREAAVSQAHAARLAAASAHLTTGAQTSVTRHDAAATRADRKRRVEVMHVRLLELRFVL